MATNKNDDGFLAQMGREPDRSQLLLKLGVGGQIVIVLWDWLAGFFLPTIGVAPITLILIGCYGAAVAFFAARVVQTAGGVKDQVDLPSHRHLTQAPRSEAHRDPSPAPVVAAATARQDPEEVTNEGLSGDAVLETLTPLFPQLYFGLRVQEEIARCRCEGSPMSVIAIDAMAPGGEYTAEVIERVSAEIARLASDQASTISLPLHVGLTEYVLCLPHSDQEEATDFAHKLVRALGDYWCHYGLAFYPEHGGGYDALVEHARADCEASREGKSRSDTGRSSDKGNGNGAKKPRSSGFFRMPQRSRP